MAKISQGPNFGGGRIGLTCLSQNFADWHICHVTISIVKKISRSLIVQEWIVIYRWLFSSRTLLSFFLCCHLCCCFHRCYCFPHLESKRAKETDLLPCLQGTEVVLPPSLRYWIGAGSRIQGRSHKHFEKTAAQISRFHCKNHRKKGQMDREKIILSRHRTC